MQLTAATGFRGMPFYFNLTTPVGRGYPNARTDDVSFVQFCFVVASAGKPIPPPPDAAAGEDEDSHCSADLGAAVRQALRSHLTT